MSAGALEQRLLDGSVFGVLPASLLRAWLATSLVRRVAIGEAWAASLPDNSAAAFISDSADAPVAWHGVDQLLGRPVLPGLSATLPITGGWLVQLPLAPLRDAITHDPALGALLGAALDLQSAAGQGAATWRVPSSPAPQRTVDWLAVLLLPVLTFNGLPLLGVGAGASAYAAALLAGLWIWLRQLAPPFVGALVILAVLVLSAVVPVEVAFGGFADTGVFLLLGILSLGSTIGSSGLAARLANGVLQRLPATARAYHLGLFSLGTLLTLVLPSGAVRIQIMAALLSRLGLRQGASDTDARVPVHLAVACLAGVSSISTVFLTSNAVNFMVLGMLPDEWRRHFGWVAWFQAAAGYLLPFLGGYLVFFWLATRGSGALLAQPAAPTAPAASRPWRAQERTAAIALSLFAIGAGTANLHHVPVPLIALALYLWLYGLGMLSDQAVTSQVNWPLLLYLTAMIGLVRSFDALRLQEELSAALTWFPQLAMHSPRMFLLMLIGAAALLRLMLPAMACISVLCIMLIALTRDSSVNPWLIAFVVVTACEGWFLPHQSSDYQLFRTGAGDVLDGQEARFLKLNAAVQLLRLAALAAAIPYWDVMGLL